MCYHMEQKQLAAQMERNFRRKVLNAEAYEPQFHSNGFSHKNFAVIAIDNGIDAIHLYRWGLVPNWVKSLAGAIKLSNQTLNAKSETIFELPSFKSSIISKRCVIPISGFFENREVSGIKYPYYIYPKNSDSFLIGGIYSSWVNKETNEVFKTFALITTPSNTMMTEIHNLRHRMPLILKEGDLDTWIDPGLNKQSIIDMMQPYPDDEMAAYTVSKDINSSKIFSDRPDITTGVKYEDIRQFY